MAKSIGTILGEIYLAFKKGELNTSSIDASKLGSGVYLYKLQMGNSVKSKKMILLK